MRGLLHTRSPKLPLPEQTVSPVGGAQLRGAGDDELGALQWPYSDREHRIELENMQ